MEEQAIRHLLNGRRYLLLQGPMGPCFSRLATWLQHSHREVKQVCFNAGDAWYAAKETALHYTGPVKNFAFWLRDLHKEYAFDTIVCFGDCRPMHVEAKKWARGKAIDFLAFEEGISGHFISPWKKARERLLLDAHRCEILSRAAAAGAENPDAMEAQRL
jgi:capsular polysaccharide export protein